NLATSKKPPQVGNLVGGGGNLGANDIEHSSRLKNFDARIQQGFGAASIPAFNSQWLGWRQLLFYRTKLGK
ncbi:MAG: hypothetical protein WCS94_22560, partial [Verrucomicrobiota bacterium]